MVNSSENLITDETTQLFSSSNSSWFQSSNELEATSKDGATGLYQQLPMYQRTTTTNTDLPAIDEVTDPLTSQPPLDFQRHQRSRHSSAATTSGGATLEQGNFPTAWPASGAFAAANSVADAAKQRHNSYSDHSILPNMTSQRSDVFAAAASMTASDVFSSGRSRAYSEGSLSIFPGLDQTCGIKPMTGGTNQSIWHIQRPGQQYRTASTSSAVFLARGAQQGISPVAALAAVAAQQAQGGSRYKTELCRPFEESGRCKYGDKCQFAHGQNELREMQRHPKYKTELCRTYHTTGYCPYGPRCHFIHEKTRPDQGCGHKKPARLLSTSDVVNDELVTSVQRMFSVPRAVPNTYINSVSASPSSSYSPPGFEDLTWGNSSPSFGTSSNNNNNVDDQVFVTPPHTPVVCNNSDGTSNNRLSVFRSLSKTE